MLIIDDKKIVDFIEQQRNRFVYTSIKKSAGISIRAGTRRYVAASNE
jgi:hypothetical protein